MQGFLGESGKVGQLDAICLLLQQQKQSPFFTQCSHSSGVIFFERLTELMSMALGSLVVLGEEKDWKIWVDFLLHWVVCSTQSH